MQLQSRLLTAAIASALVASAPAFAASIGQSSAAVRAQGLIDGPAAAAVHRAGADGFVARTVDLGTNGVEHVRFNRTYRGLPVIGGDFVMHSRNGHVVGVSQTLKTSVRPDIVPQVTSQRAVIEAGARFGVDFVGKPTSRLVIYARGGIQPVLAHEVIFSGFKADQTPTDMHYFVDARNGRILAQWDTVETAVPGRNSTTCTTPVSATGSGRTLTEGTVVLKTAKCGSTYQLKDLSRGGGRTTNMAMRTSGMGTLYTDADNTWGNSGLTDSATVAADAHYGVSVTWDYYAATFGRNGIANNGSGALSRVHYGRKYANAFWSDSCFCMTFGDGDNGVTINPLVALDVAGHEMSHGVSAREANLTYSGESGGLNEANSDIMGTMVEFFANNANDPGDYLIGEKVYAHNTSGLNALRWMFKPSLDGHSADCYDSNVGNLDVHYSSGVANHFYYLLAEGAVVPAGFGAGTSADLTSDSLVCNGNTAIVGIGRADAQQIWYHAMADYMTSDTTYADARQATLSVATDLFGSASAQFNAVAAAWDAVDVTAL